MTRKKFLILAVLIAWFSRDGYHWPKITYRNLPASWEAVLKGPEQR
jgi:hypothetical protein